MKKIQSIRRAFVSFSDLRPVLAAAMVVMLALPLSASGNPVPGRWQKVATLEEGTVIIVRTDAGETLECLYQQIVDGSLTPVRRDDFRMAGDRVWVGYGEESGEDVFSSLIEEGALDCRDIEGKRRLFPLGSVTRIMLPKPRQYAGEWAVWGAVAGALAGALISTASFDFTPEGHFGSACAGAGIGALGGGLAGYSAGSPGETIYISPEAASEKEGS